jgi:phosphatidylserine decarboxylase
MKFSRSRLSKYVIPSYIKIFNINIEEIDGEVKDYSSLHQFFTRKLKQNARAIDNSSSSIISPVDAKIEQFGNITEHLNFIVKNQTYSIKEMLEDEELVQRYKDGSFIVLYLSPSHYHRIHSPVEGKVKKRYSLGQHSYPVNKWGLKYGKSPLSKNFRTISVIETIDGNQIAMIKVGAMFINTIEMTHQSDNLYRNEEMGYFSFGSTVVLLFEKDKIKLADMVLPHQEVKVGERIAKFVR